MDNDELRCWLDEKGLVGSISNDCRYPYVETTFNVTHINFDGRVQVEAMVLTVTPKEIYFHAGEEDDDGCTPCMQVSELKNIVLIADEIQNDFIWKIRK